VCDGCGHCPDTGITAADVTTADVTTADGTTTDSTTAGITTACTTNARATDHCTEQREDRHHHRVSEGSAIERGTELDSGRADHAAPSVRGRYRGRAKLHPHERHDLDRVGRHDGHHGNDARHHCWNDGKYHRHEIEQREWTDL